MAKYDPGDIVTYYFIIYYEGTKRKLQAWTDDKKMAKYYLEFHKCKRFKLRKYVGSIEEVNKICEENLHDEIKIYNFTTKCRDKHKESETGTILIPATYTEYRFVNEECNTFLSTFIPYSYFNEAISYLKPKYRKILKDIFLTDIIDHEIHGIGRKIVTFFEFDQLAILFKSFPDNFGV